jgi:hypothetical protein
VIVTEPTDGITVPGTSLTSVATMVWVWAETTVVPTTIGEVTTVTMVFVAVWVENADEARTDPLEETECRVDRERDVEDDLNVVKVVDEVVNVSETTVVDVDRMVVVDSGMVIWVVK